MTTTASESRRAQGIALSRRQFVKTSALALGSVSLASVPTIIPAAAFGANDCIRVGVIGCGGQGTGHVHSLVNWIDAMRGKGAVFCNEDLGCSTMVAIKMGVESYRQRKTLLWDAAKEKVYTA